MQDGIKANGNGMPMYSINKAEDQFVTKIGAKFIIHDFEKSHNNQVITEEECAANKDTLIGYPVLTKYFNEGQKEKDHLGTHETYITKNRDTGTDMMATDTISIGTFVGAEIEDVVVGGVEKRCLVGYSELWMDRYYNICSLLNEWLEKKIPIYCSCEYIFRNYEMIDGVQYIKSPIAYTGHTILNSEEKDGYGIVLPAYDSATMVSWNAALEKDQEEFSKKCEGEKLENVFIKSLNEISLGDIRDGIHEAVKKVMTAEEYQYFWVGIWDVYETYFIYDNYVDNEWKKFKVNYSKDENDNIVVDFESKVEVKRETIYVEVTEVQSQIETALNAEKEQAERTIQELNETINQKDIALNEATQDVVAQKEAVVSLNETIVSLNSEIETLSDYKQKYETARYEENLKSANAFYEEKFSKLNAEDKFALDEVQELVKETLDAEKSLNAKSKLADMLINLIDEVKAPQKAPKVVEGQPIVELGSGIGSLNTKQQKTKVIKDLEMYGFNEIV